MNRSQSGGVDTMRWGIATAVLVALGGWTSAAANPAPDPWGAFRHLAGQCWSGSTVTCWEWTVPGERMRTLIYDGGRIIELRFSLDPAGSVITGSDGSLLQSPRAGVTVREFPGHGSRVIYRQQPGLLDLVWERHVGDRWVHDRDEQRTAADVEQVMQAHREIQAAKLAAMSELRPRWGALVDLADQVFVGPGMAIGINWAEQGRTLKFNAIYARGHGDKVRVVSLDPANGRLSSKTTYRTQWGGWFERPEEVFVLADGGVYFTDPGVRVGRDEAGNLTLQPGKGRRRSGDFTPSGPLSQLGRGSLAEYNAMVADSERAAEANRQYSAELQRANAAQQAEKPDRSGLFGALVGAAVGAYAGSAAGLDSASTAALMMQGAAATGAGGAVADGFARGLAEESAKQEAMQRGLEDARMSGMAQGAAEYAARQEAQARQLAQQRRADADHAQRVREQEQAAREARLAAQQQAGNASAVPRSPQGETGPALVVTSSERAPAVDAAGGATRPASRYAWCMARQEHHEGERGKAVLYLSDVAEVDAAQASQTDRMAVNFRAALPASNRIAPPICATEPDRASADTMLRNLPDRYPGWEVVRTGVAPHP